MIYGLVPVGGKGVRLSLPFPKELLPQKGFDYYNPLANHIVEKMRIAGADKIVFVHGVEMKAGIVQHFADTRRMIHLTQTKPGFATVLGDFYEYISPGPSDVILFGMPDTVFEGNPFPEMVEQEGLVCGLFTTVPESAVDRLLLDGSGFQVKTPKTSVNSDHFWGTIKFMGEHVASIVERGLLEKTSEVGEVLNSLPKSYVFGGEYADLGTWGNYNRYLNSQKDWT